MISDLINALNPNPDTLLRAISSHITDDMLEEIARADYGLDPEKHLAALLLVRDENRFVEPMHMYPCEVLELVRSSGSENREDGDWIRAFASAALLRARLPPWNYGADAAYPSYNLIQLIKGLRGLHGDLTVEASQFVAWLFAHSDLEGEDEEVLYYGVGLLWFALHLNEPPPDELLIELCEWIVLREAALAEALPGGFDRWLLGIRADYPSPSPWEHFGPVLFGLDLSSHSVQLQDWVRLIGSQLAEG
jgi:hypothetical protein